MRYDGEFDPAHSGLARGVSTRTDVVGYRAAAEPKAAAYHPQGRLYAVTAATSQRAAEEQALLTCNVDPDRNGADGRCYLYAVGNQVVLPLRLQGPKTPATVAAAPTATPPPNPSVGAPPLTVPSVGTAPAPPAPTAPTGIREALLARFAAAVPSMPANLREARCALRGGQAQQGPGRLVGAAGTWRTVEWPTPALAEKRSWRAARSIMGTVRAGVGQ